MANDDTVDTGTKAEDVELPTCRTCGRRAGLSGGLCASCLGEHHGYSQKEVANLDRALAALREQAVRDKWVGKKPDLRHCPKGVG
jgi:hypothetical protein